MSAPNLVYLVTRAHGLKTHLLTAEGFGMLMRSKDVVEMADYLLRTDYSEELGRLPARAVDASSLEKVFLGKMVSRFFFLANISPPGVQEFLFDYAKRFEVENIKRIIKAKHPASKEPLEERLIPLTREQTIVNFSGLLETEDVEKAVELLAETAYARVGGSLDLYSKYGSTLALESHLDRMFYERVWAGLERISDRKDVEHLLKVEVDVKNLLMMLSMRMREVEPGLIEHLIIPRGLLGREKLEPIVHGGPEEISEALRAPPYAGVAERIAGVLRRKGYMHRADVALSALLYNEAELAMRRNPHKFVYVMGYLLQCELEAKNLTTIAMAKQLRLPDALLSEILVPRRL